MIIVEEDVLFVYIVLGQFGVFVIYWLWYGYYIGGEFVEFVKGQYFENISFVNGKFFIEVGCGIVEDID